MHKIGWQKYFPIASFNSSFNKPFIMLLFILHVFKRIKCDYSPDTRNFSQQNHMKRVEKR